MGATGNPANKPLLHESYLPDFVPTDEQRNTVRVMKLCGMPNLHIAREVFNPHTNEPISITTLKRYFADELRHGKDQANALVANALFKKCLGNSPQAVAACIFWLRSQAGWLAPESIDMNMTGEKSSGKQQLVVYVPDNGRRAANTGATKTGASDAKTTRFVRKS
ncbi:hypothetical protein ACGYQ5_14265 [Burkholderia pseudomallei]